ncbi:MAG: hypothetical protein ACOX8W_11925 [bacterium]|jgi:hypothetical protein
MKTYGEYMDRISVETDLHCNIVRRMRSAASRPAPARRFLAVAACAVILLVAAIRHAPEPSQPALHFNQALGMADAAKRYLPGYFTQDLTAAELADLLGGLPAAWQEYQLNASAGFSGEGILDAVFVHGEDKESGRRITFVLTAPPGRIRDYIYPGPPVLSAVNGITVLAGSWANPAAPETTIYYCSFSHGGAEYYIEITGGNNARSEPETAADEIAGLAAHITAGAGADPSKIKPLSIPEWREDDLTLPQAQADPDFGLYVPGSVPAGFRFASARRSLGQSRDELSITYESGLRDIRIVIGRSCADSKERTVNLGETEKYDLALYPIPRAESVPDKLRAIVSNPVFRAEEITLAAVTARAYQISDAGDDNTACRMRFSVASGDIVASFNIKGAWPEDIFLLVKDMFDIGE